MIKTTDVLQGKEKFNLKMMAIGGSGSGKTHFASSFPKCYFLMTEPSGEDTFLTNPALAKNVVGFDRFIPENPLDTKRVFKELAEATLMAKEMAKKGEIETLVLDNISFLTENRWVYIDSYERELSARTGEVNGQAMYGKLARWMYQFVLMNLLTFPGNVVVTAHEQLESDEALEKKPDKTTPVLPNILGGFRDKVDGMFSLVVYLNKLKEGSKYRYMCRTNKGNQRNAKSRIILPEIIEDISYGKLREIVDKALGLKQ